MFGQRRFEDVGSVTVQGVVVQVIPEATWSEYFGLFAPADAPREAKGRFVINVVPAEAYAAPWWRRLGRPEWQYAVIVDKAYEVGAVVVLSCVEMQQVQKKKPLAWARLAGEA